MTYQVKFTELTNKTKPPLTIEDERLNTLTSLGFPGKNFSGYSVVMAENFLHLLENFASSTAPLTPVEGQLWYDNSASNAVLKVFNGNNWTPASSITKSPSTSKPTTGNKGDIWVSTDTQQLYIYSGSGWVLVGPQYSAGSKSGAIVETLSDGNSNYNVTSIFSDNNRLVIISTSQFTPNPKIPGFSTIYVGLNITSTGSAKVWATADKARNLEVADNQVVSASKFIRSDSPAIFEKSVVIQDNTGLTFGTSSNYSLAISDSGLTTISNVDGSSISFKLTNNAVKNTVLHVAAAKKIGINNTIPQTELDVTGSITVSDNLIVNGTTDSTGLTITDTASIFTKGGLSVLKTSWFGGVIKSTNRIQVGLPESVITDSTSFGAALLIPDKAAAYDIGTSIFTFRNIYAEQFVGKFAGTFSGQFTGDLTASKLASSTSFSLDGDITSNTISFNGQGTGSAVFTTTTSPSLITNKTLLDSANNDDLLLVYRPGAGSTGGLRSVSKGAFLSSMPTIPIGSIMPFAGDSTMIPKGYLLCDGSEVLIDDYAQLFTLIRYMYKPFNQLVGTSTFALPDLRGRFAMGVSNMDNKLSITVGGISADAGGGLTNVTTDINAASIGGVGGSEYKNLTVENLPEHYHTLQSKSGQQYYAAGVPGSQEDANATLGYGLPDTSTGYGLANSGGIDGVTTHGTAINALNPFLAINYIIFTGEI